MEILPATSKSILMLCSSNEKAWNRWGNKGKLASNNKKSISIESNPLDNISWCETHLAVCTLSALLTAVFKCVLCQAAAL